MPSLLPHCHWTTSGKAGAWRRRISQETCRPSKITNRRGVREGHPCLPQPQRSRAYFRTVHPQLQVRLQGDCPMLPRVIALLTGLGLCALAQANPTQYPLTLENCGSTLTFPQAPARSVTIGQAATEMLYALGVGDKVVGTSLWFNNVLPQFKALNDSIERLANNEPSFESVIAKRPQLVAAELEWVVGPQGVVGTREQFHELKIATYLLPSDCEGRTTEWAPTARGWSHSVSTRSTRASANWPRFSTYKIAASNSTMNSRRAWPSPLPLCTARGSSRPARWCGSPAPRWPAIPTWPATRASLSSCCKPSACATWCSPMRNGPPSAGKPSPRPTPPCW